jgi:hypothetical protein
VLDAAEFLRNCGFRNPGEVRRAFGLTAAACRVVVVERPAEPEPAAPILVSAFPVRSLRPEELDARPTLFTEGHVPSLSMLCLHATTQSAWNGCGALAGLDDFPRRP